MALADRISSPIRESGSWERGEMWLAQQEIRFLGNPFPGRVGTERKFWAKAQESARRDDGCSRWHREHRSDHKAEFLGQAVKVDYRSQAIYLKLEGFHFMTIFPCNT